MITPPIHGSVFDDRQQGSVTEYCLDLLNVDFNLEALCAGLRRTGEGRLCLYGPPGTGKTAFGQHVASVVDRPLLVKQASDLLRSYLGETEQRIAAMFEEAANRHIGARPLPDAQPVIAEITLRRFHGVTERTRFSVGGVYSIRFDLQLLDAGTREPLGEVRTIQADLPAPGGIAAVELERAGQTERVRVVDHLTWTLQRELRLPAPG